MGVEPTLPKVDDSHPMSRFKYCLFIALGASHPRGSRTSLDGQGDVHWNEAGHRLVAELFTQDLAGRN